MKKYFIEVTNLISELIHPNESFTVNLFGESSDFCRFNEGKVRQSGHVKDDRISIQLILGKKHISEMLAVSGNLAEDRLCIEASVLRLREMIDFVPDDPYFLINTQIQSSDHRQVGELENSLTIVEDILTLSRGLDFVGILASGCVRRGFSNSLGQLNWYETETFNLDWSIYLEADKAIKQNLAGFRWDKSRLEIKLNEAREQLEILRKPSKKIEPGKYRVFLSPSALSEIFSLLGWSSFGLKSYKSKTSSLIKLFEGYHKLSENFHLSEATAESISPDFDRSGFLKPDESKLIVSGEFENALTCARSAQEFGVEHNGANPRESPQSLAMAGGTLDSENILETLGTGIYINNLWYLNFSDKNSCKMTGMTRFAAFWVEDGKIISPVDVMRFDENFYRMFGENLVALTKQRELMLDSSSYGGRATSSFNLPGAVIKDFSFTL